MHHPFDYNFYYGDVVDKAALKIGELLSSLPQSTITGDDISLSDNVTRKIFRFAGLRKSDIFYHLGCGTGNAVALAAREFGAKLSVGIEKDEATAAAARTATADMKNAKIINGDIRESRISDATILLFWFTSPDIIETMTARFRKELKKGARVITIWAPLGMTLPDKMEFPFFVSKTPFRRARSIREQIKAIYGNKCVDFTAAWLLAGRYIDAFEVVPGNYRRFVNILQSMVIWINAWNMGVACEKEVPPPVNTYVGILKTFFNIDLSEMIKEKK